MASPDMRIALVTEVEENVNHSNDRSKASSRLDAITTWISSFAKDNLVTPEAIARCQEAGLDWRYSWHNKLPVDKNVTRPTQEESLLESRLETFLSTYSSSLAVDESLSYAPSSAEGAEDGGNSSVSTSAVAGEGWGLKEHLLNLRVHEQTLEMLLGPLRDSRPHLYRQIMQHPLVTGKHRLLKKKSSDKEKDKEAKRKSSSASAPFATGVRQTKRERTDEDSIATAAAVIAPPAVPESREEGSGRCTRVDVASPTSSPAQLRHAVALIVAQALVDGSMQALLFAVVILIQYAHALAAFPDVSESDRAVPIGDLLYAVFEKHKSSASALLTGEASPVVPNPFRRCILSESLYSKSRPKSGYAMSESASRAGDVLSDGGATEEGGSSVSAYPGSTSSMFRTVRLGSDELRAFVGAYSDAGSVIGSTVGSALAERGTDNASSVGGDLVDALDLEDASEDELLAQALAMSLASSAAMRVSGTVGLSGVGAGSADAGSVREQSVESPMTEFTRDEGRLFEKGHIDSLVHINFKQLKDVHPMSTFGPFCNEHFWQVGFVPLQNGVIPTIHETSNFKCSIDVPIPTVIATLLVYIRGGIDALFSENSAPFMKNGGSANQESGRLESTLLVPTNLELSPLQPSHFMLTEYLLDYFADCLHPSSSLSSTAACCVGMSYVEVKDGTHGAMLSKYLCTWSTTTMLNIIKSCFRMANLSKTSLIAMGLSVGASDMARSFGSLMSRGTYSVPLVAKILRLIVECIGHLHLPNSAPDVNRFDGALGDSGSIDINELLRDAAFMTQAVDVEGPTSSRGRVDSDDLSSQAWWGESSANFRHWITLSGIDAFCHGFPVMFASNTDRENVYFAILSNSPATYGPLDACSYEIESLPPLQQIGFTKACASSKRLVSYYARALLQRLSKGIASQRLEPFFLSCNNGGLMLAKGGATSSIFDVCDETQTMKFSVGFRPNVIDRGDDHSPSIQRSLTYQLLERMKDPFLMKSILSYRDTSVRRELVRESSIYGELCLFETLQQNVMEQFSKPAQVLPSQILFDKDMCNKNISISADGKSVTMQSRKVWSTVMSTSIFLPSTGVHKWSIVADRCEKGNIFIGVVTPDTGLDSYVGSNKFGWGFIGTPSLWHNRVKTKTDYGVKLTDGMVVEVILDTNKRTLSFVIAGTDWGIAFDSLPASALIPAVSLYQAGDRVSFLSQNLPASTEAMEGATGQIARTANDYLVANRKSVVDLFSVLLVEAEKILQTLIALNTTDVEDITAVIHHPLLVTFLPQAIASLISDNRSAKNMEWSSYKAFRWLPQLMIIVKLLSAVFDKFNSLPGFDTRCFIGGIAGKWRISSAASGAMPAQVYNIQLFNDGAPRNDRSNGSHESTLSKAANHAYLFAGAGESGSSKVEISGVQLGTRVVISECWEGSNACSVEARLSLDGSQMNGSFTAESGQTGSLSAVLIENDAENIALYRPCNTILKLAKLGTRALGFLAAELANSLEPSGMKISESIMEPIVSSKAAARPAEAGSPDADEDELMDVEGGDRLEGDEVEDEDGQADENNEGGSARGDNEELEDYIQQGDDDDEDDLDDGDPGRNTSQANDIIPAHMTEEAPTAPSVNLINRWLASALLSNGVELDNAVKQIVRDEIEVYFEREPESPGLPLRKKTRREYDSDRSSSREVLLLQWWKAKIFPLLYGSDQSVASLTPICDPEALSVSEDNMPSFCKALINARHASCTSAAAAALDVHVINHTGSVNVARIGGDAIQHARRVVLAAMIKHTGCANLCERIAEELTAARLSSESRPNALLMQLWRGAQRVAEYAIRKKQESGISYQFLGQELCQKAEIMLSIQPQVSSLVISEIVSLVPSEHLNAAPFTEIQNPMSKILAECIEFMQLSVLECSHIKTVLLHAAFKGLTRTAAFNMFGAMLGKLEAPEYSGIGTLPVLTSPMLQSTLLEYMLATLYHCSELSSLPHATSTSASNETASLSKPASMSNLAEGEPNSPQGTGLGALSSPGNGTSPSGAPGARTGHYGEGLKGCCADVFQDLRRRFEHLFDHVTQLLQRSTWGFERDGQCVSLVCWNILIKAEDHSFMNRCGIFKVLQSVLDDSRNTLDELVKYSTDAQMLNDVSQLAKTGRTNALLLKTVVDSIRTMTKLAVLTVHSLASQVASTKESTSTLAVGISTDRPLLRQPSGPETLTEALFDMLFSELYSCVRKMVLACKTDGPAFLDQCKWSGLRDASSGSNFVTLTPSKEVAASKTGRGTSKSDKNQVKYIDGEIYAYRILRLLYGVVTTPVCCRYLSSPKWITLLCFGLGHGGPGVQRRLLKLLRRIVTSIEADGMNAFIPSYLGADVDIFESNAPFTDEDSVTLLGGEFAGPGSSAAAFVRLMLRCIGLLLPDHCNVGDHCDSKEPALEHQNSLDIAKLSFALRTNDVIAFESLGLLRKLTEDPQWSQILSSVLQSLLQPCGSPPSSEASLGPDSASAVHALSVLGGCFEKVREGGMVMLRPLLTLGSQGSESFGAKLLSMSHASGLVVNKLKSSNAVELLLNDRFATQAMVAKYGSAYCSMTSPLDMIIDPSVAPPQQHTTKISRVPLGEVSPLGEGVPKFSNLSKDLVTSFVRYIASTNIPYAKSILIPPDNPSPSDRREPSAFESYATVVALKSLARATESENVVDSFVSMVPGQLGDLLELSLMESTSGGLSVVEKIEDHFSSLWDAFILSGFDAIEGDQEVLAAPETPSSEENEGKGVESGSSSSIPPAAPEMAAPSPSAGGPGNRQVALERAEGLWATLLGSRGIFRTQPPARPQPFQVSEEAKQTMLEMGFPPEWCDAALRRSRNNVQVAINICFEQGDDMGRLVEEDQMLRQQEQLRAQQPAPPRAELPPPGGLLRRSIDEGNGLGAGGVDLEAVVQLANLGFPSRWCFRALAATNNDPQEALVWIMNHTDELIAENPGSARALRNADAVLERRGRESSAPTSRSDASFNEPLLRNGSQTSESLTSTSAGEAVTANPYFGPLSVISGNASIKSNGVCTGTFENGFPSVGCRGYAVHKGKWYFEVKLHSSTCVQIGWADCGFVGGADSGEGVGDDVHSWAFDGWRTMLWHEVSSDWGARWAAGNVVGCAVDLDSAEKSMYFTLNGEAESIGMGRAFEGFQCSGGLYPAASFNKLEEIEFIFDAGRFHHQPPEGYRSFGEHVSVVDEIRYSAQKVAREALGSPQDYTPTISTPRSGGEKLIAVDSVEEELKGFESSWNKRYFASDDSNRIGGNTCPLPEAGLSITIPTNKAEVIKKIQKVSADLLVIYARIAVLNIMRSAVVSKQESFVQLLLDSRLPDDRFSVLEAFIKLLRLNSITSNRTRLYHQLMKLSLPGEKPLNIGSMYSIGGFPFVEFMSSSLSALLSRTRTLKSESFIDACMAQIQSDLTRSTQREHCDKWRPATGIVPYLAIQGKLPDSVCAVLPSLTLPLGLTIILMKQFTSEFGSDVSSRDAIIKRIVEINRMWCITLNSPNPNVKLCGIRMINSIFQEALSMCHDMEPSRQAQIILAVTEPIPLNRLRNLVLARIASERGTSPIFSEYLQLLAEFVNTVSSTLSLASGVGDADLKASEAVSVSTNVTELPPSRLENDDSRSDFNWDAVHGTLATDAGWDIWTGTLRQHPIEGIDEYAKLSSVNTLDKQKQPPELLVGCYVLRKMKIPVETEGEETIGGNASASVPATDQPESPEVDRNGEAEDSLSRTTSGRMDAFVTEVHAQMRRHEEQRMDEEDEEDEEDEGGEEVNPSLPSAPASAAPSLQRSPAAGRGATDDHADVLSAMRQRLVDRSNRTTSEIFDTDRLMTLMFGGSVPPRESRTPARARAASPKFRMQYDVGVVTAIVPFGKEGAPAGSGRRVRWLKRANTYTEHDVKSLEFSVLQSEADAASADSCGGSTSEATSAAIAFEEVVSWGYRGKYEVTHVSLNAEGAIAQEHPLPCNNFCRSLRNGFGSEHSYGVVLRLRRSVEYDRARDACSENDVFCDGVMEWPDFGASVYVCGHSSRDGGLVLTEERLVRGTQHASWSVRFGHPNWRPGTTYRLRSSNSGCLDKFNTTFEGSFEIEVPSWIDCNTTAMITGDVSLQQERLFLFDSKVHSQAISISFNGLSASNNGGESRSMAFATVGFTHGVHYWEFKVEQADVGNLFIGVCEKLSPVGSPSPAKLNRWFGHGITNIRSSYRNTPSGTIERIYGDHFHTGDTIGVLLDMNRGRISFFLDGLKYGEHVLADLGEAFDGLAPAPRVRTKALYPVVGTRRAGDRVAITSRWLSNYGPETSELLDVINRTCGLLTSWNIERSTIQPLARDLWIYREAWREYVNWQCRTIDRVRTRARIPLLYVGVDTSPRPCVEASIRLGLSFALFRGDRILIKSSNGRPLEGGGEEAVILGAYKGQLWYRPDTQYGGTSSSSGNTSAPSLPVVMEGSAAAWVLAPHDVVGIVLSRRSGAVDARICDVKLARLPAYQGARLRIEYPAGAIMRDGLEIDTSEVVGTAATASIVTALERRTNSSNIVRFRVLVNGRVGWISERIRGGQEEFMVSEVHGEPHEVVQQGLADAIGALQAARPADSTYVDPCETPFIDVNSLDDAMRVWEGDVRGSGCADDMIQYVLNNRVNDAVRSFTFDQFLELASTSDGSSPWHVEADMELTEFISRAAAADGISPLNLAAPRLKAALVASDVASSSNSMLANISMERLMARAAVLRVANIIFGYSLPYINVNVVDELLQLDAFGRVDDIDAIITTHGDETITSAPAMKSSALHWSPTSAGRKLRSLRRLLFSQTKMAFFDSVMDMTTTATALPQDEYEDPREIKTLKINRVMATHANLANISSFLERLKTSVFGQMHKEMRGWNPSAFRRSYIGKGHGGQKRAFKVKFTGEGVNDYGGPYRALFEEVVDEAQADSIPISGQKPWEKTLLTILSPCPNRSSGTGINQDKFVFTPSSMSINEPELINFLGKLAGLGVRHNLNLALDFSSMIWRPLVRLPVTRAHLQTIDTLVASRLADIERIGTIYSDYVSSCGDTESRQNLIAYYETLGLGPNIPSPDELDASFVPEEWADLTFTTYYSDGVNRVNLIPNGDGVAVNLGNWRQYVKLVEACRLREGSMQLRAFKEGLAASVPIELLPLFNASELELVVSGSRNVDVKLLRQCTEYDGLQPDSALVCNFWSVLEEMSNDEKTMFLRFVWARSRMPATAQDLPMNFKLCAATTPAAEADRYLPHAQTCFFLLSLPSYSSKEVLRDKLLYAIKNSPNMDADVRLHNAEGWAE